MRFLVNLFGILGILTTVVIYQQKDNQRMLVWKLISDLCWVLHYLALGANSVAVVTIVAIMRSVVLLCRRHRWAQSRAWLAVFMISSFVLSVLAYKDWTSLLTMFGSQACIVAYWIGRPKITRVVSMPVALMFLVNVTLNGSFWGMLCESFLLASAIVGFIRHDVVRKPKTAKE